VKLKAGALQFRKMQPLNVFGMATYPHYVPENKAGITFKNDMGKRKIFKFKKNIVIPAPGVSQDWILVGIVSV
jgi:hypothetical protein